MAEQPSNLNPPQSSIPPIDASNVENVYVNFFFLSGNADEVLMDVGILSQITGPQGPEPAHLTHRLILNYRNAKQLAGLLREVIHRHEQAFGVIETDLSRRLRSAQQQQKPPQG